MTDFTSLLLADRRQPARTLHPIRAGEFDTWLLAQPERTRTVVAAARFTGAEGTLVIVPGDRPDDWSAAIGLEEGPLGPWSLAAAISRLPEGHYRLAEGAPGDAALGWLLAQHRFDRYRRDAQPEPKRILLTTDAVRIDETVRIAAAVALVRDMVDTPSSDMGPTDLAANVETVARRHKATVRITDSDALRQGYPMIHAVGRAAAPHRQPKLIELEWGNSAHPRIALVGKGVCFDTGGLDIKPPAGMLLMKKDMGGAAHALASADLVMGTRLPVRLHLLIPAVENAISGDSFRPGDVLPSRAGIHVEIGNTDAEGRLVLADALTRAQEDHPALLIDFATLTGAARVALGPDLPPLFVNDDALAADLLAASDAVADPIWRMPLWKPYRELMKSDLADINNAGASPFAGAVTAALFLQEFVAPTVPWAHFDTFAWTPAAKPGRPKGGEALGLRAAYAMLRARYLPPKHT